MNRETVRSHACILAALLLFAVYAVCILAVLLSASEVCRRLTARGQTAFDRRTCCQYVAAHVRQADRAGGWSVEDFAGVQVLVLDPGGGYVKRIYCWDGYLMELYCERTAKLAPEDGERVMEADALHLTLDNGLLAVRLTGPWGEQSLMLSRRSGEEGIN